MNESEGGKLLRKNDIKKNYYVMQKKKKNHIKENIYIYNYTYISYAIL